MKVVFFDVDTQNDFMKSSGALPVPNAGDIVSNLGRLTNLANRMKIKILGSVDRHFNNDKELMRNGGPFPDHCMDGSEGQKKICCTLLDDVIFIENRNYSDEDLKKALEHKQIIVEKQTYDATSNPNLLKILKMMDVNEVIVYGVATDYCVKSVVMSLLKNNFKVKVVRDAIKAVNEKTGENAVKEMKEAGVEFITTEGVERYVQDSYIG